MGCRTAALALVGLALLAGPASAARKAARQPAAAVAPAAAAPPPTATAAPAQPSEAAAPAPTAPSRTLAQTGLTADTPPSPDGEERRIIGEYVRSRLPQLTRCYEDRLTDLPGLQGRMMARFDIGPNGRVLGVSADGLDDRDLIRCVTETIRAWQFHKPASGGKLRVAYPIVFQSRS